MFKKYWDYDIPFTAGALFVFMLFVNIGRLRPWLAPFRPLLVVGIIAILLLLLRAARGEAPVGLGKAGWCWAALTVSSWLSAVFAPKAQDVAIVGATGMFKHLALYFIVYNIITSFKTLRGAYWVILLSLTAMVYFAVKVMIFTGGRLTLYVGPFYGSNETAMGMAMFLPFCLMLAARPTREFKWRWGFVVLSVLCVLLIIRTFSRGGFLAMGVGLILWAIHEKRKGLAFVFSCALVSLLAYVSTRVYMGPEPKESDSYLSRIQLILKARSASERDPSAQGRIDLAKEAINLWRQYPLLGIGVGCYNEHCKWEPYRIYLEAGRQVNAAVHNSVLHALLEVGLMGFIPYVLLLFITYQNIQVARKWPGKGGFLTAVIEATHISYIVYMVAGMFLSEQWNWCFSIYTAIIAGARKVIENARRKSYVNGLLRDRFETKRRPVEAGLNTLLPRGG